MRTWMFKKSLHTVVHSLKLLKIVSRKKVSITGKVTVCQLVTTYIEIRHQLSTVSQNIRHLLDCFVAHQIQQLLGGSGIWCFVREHRANHESQLIR